MESGSFTWLPVSPKWTLRYLTLGWRCNTVQDIIIFMNAYSIMMIVTANLGICEDTSDEHSIGSEFGGLEAFKRVNLGKAVVMFLADGILSCFSRMIIMWAERIPFKDEYGVEVAMGFGGLASFITVSRMAFLAQLPMRYTPGSLDCTCEY